MVSERFLFFLKRAFCAVLGAHVSSSALRSGSELSPNDVKKLHLIWKSHHKLGHVNRADRNDMSGLGMHNG